MKAIIDGDSIPYVVSYNQREADEEVFVVMETDRRVQEILEVTGATSHVGFLKGTNNFRDTIATIAGYKANRNSTKPEWLERWSAVVINRLINHWGFVQVTGMESDDAVAIVACDLREKSMPFVICSSDKDLKQVYGNHYNMAKGELTYIAPYEAERLFWKQMITGDSTDNIKGIPGKGDVFAEKLLSAIPVSNLSIEVFKAYVAVLGTETGPKYFSENYLLLKMMNKWPGEPLCSY